ncbi:MAG: translation initiation factor IF-3 [Lentisphaerae bacterium GWF2_52_8]|nr:MAG: translation initiation factor IF-3 [Lentisphaerae bacterium GWF2_52_8]
MARLIKPNDRVFAPDFQVRVVGADGEQHGVVTFDDARRLAKEAKLDLVLVAETSTPPVCRIMDFGKLRYEQKKKVKDQKKHQLAQKLKEVKFRVSIDEHDFGYKIEHSIEFLSKGCKLKITLMFRGREMAHQEIGFDLMKRIITTLAEHGTPESEPKLFGRNIVVNFNPKHHH